MAKNLTAMRERLMGLPNGGSSNSNKYDDDDDGDHYMGKRMDIIRNNSSDSTDQTSIRLSDRIEELHENILINPDKIITGISNDNNDVDKILVHEFNNLNFTTRTVIQEEIHGAHCMAIEETPELLVEKLKELEMELKNDRSPSRAAYVRSQQLQRQTDQQQDRVQSSQSQSKSKSHQSQICYVNSDEFRLMYLRSELFDVKKTVDRILKAMNFLVQYFGEYALERKIRLSDFNKNELKVMRQGYMQLLPSRDQGGRRIIMCIMSENVPDDSGSEKYIMTKILFYLIFVCGSTDIENQRKGFVMLFWNEHLLKYRMEARKGKLQITFAPVRVVSIHFCAKSSLFINLIRSVLVARLTQDLRQRFISTPADNIEGRYILQGFGIPVDDLPVSWTGTIKKGNMKRFMNLRSYVEDESIRNNNNNTISASIIIDCPHMNDILFKRGQNAVEHNSGNYMLKTVVKSVYEKYLQHQQEQHRLEPSKPIVEISISNLLPDILNEIQRENLRILVWNKQKLWWNLIVDECDYKKHVYHRAAYIIISIKESAKAASVPASCLSSSTTSTSNAILNRNPQITHSDTSIFMSEGKKRKRLSITATATTTDTNNYNDRRSSNIFDDGNDNNFSDMNCLDQCFGLPFMPMQGNDNNDSQHLKFKDV